MKEIDHPDLVSSLEEIIISYQDCIGPFAMNLISQLTNSYFSYKKNQEKDQLCTNNNDNNNIVSLEGVQNINKSGIDNKNNVSLDDEDSEEDMAGNKSSFAS